MFFWLRLVIGTSRLQRDPHQEFFQINISEIWSAKRMFWRLHNLSYSAIESSCTERLAHGQTILSILGTWSQLTFLNIKLTKVEKVQNYVFTIYINSNVASPRHWFGNAMQIFRCIHCNTAIILKVRLLRGRRVSTYPRMSCYQKSMLSGFYQFVNIWSGRKIVKNVTCYIY